MSITTVSSHVVSVNAIQGTLIADNAITAVHIATNAVSGTLIADNAVTATHIAQNTITVTQIADDAIEAPKIADGVITTNHLNKAMISSQTEVTAVAGDFLLLGDTSDSNNLKKTPISDIVALAGVAGISSSADATAITIDSSEKVGIGKSPSTWHLDVDSTDVYIASFDGSNNTGVAINSSSSIADIIGYSNSASSYNALNIRGASGTGLVVDTSNRVGIGTASPSRELDIQAASGWAELALRGASGSSGSLEYFNASTKLAEIYADTSTNIIFRNSTSGTTERMRINASGCIGLGTTADRSLGTNITTTVTSGSAGSGFWMSTGNSSATSTKLISYQNGSVGEFKINQGSGVNGGSILFSINDAEKMRINSNGKIGINKIDGTGMLNIQSNSDYTRLIELFGSGTSSAVASLRIGISGNNSQIPMIGGVSAGYAGLSYHYYYLVPQIQQSDNNGDLRLGGASNRFHTVYSVNGVSTSDERVKEEIENLDVGLAFIKSLKPKKFRYKDKDSDGNYKDGKLEQKNGVKKWGLIAQDVKKALDDNSITEDIGLWSFEKGECNGKVIENQQQLQYQELISPLIKAIQELEARIATLEG